MTALDLLLWSVAILAAFVVLAVVLVGAWLAVEVVTDALDARRARRRMENGSQS